jgi:hypothetical protein
VIGLSIPSGHGRFAPASASIHVGAKTWSSDLAGPARARFANDDRARVFSGCGMMGARFVDAVVLELNARELESTDALDVWAEISGGEQPRRRLGNPIVAELVRCDRELAQLHRQISPADDRAILGPLVTRIMASRARRHGIVSDPDAYARRLADAILPDVISFSPLRPSASAMPARTAGILPKEPPRSFVRCWAVHRFRSPTSKGQRRLIASLT